MGRTFAYFVVIGTLLAVLTVVVVNRSGNPGVSEGVPDMEPTSAPPSTAEPRSQPPASAPPVETPWLPARVEPNMLTAITRQPLPDIVSPPWADEMEGAILNYIAQRQGLELTELQVQCAVEQCVIFMGGASIPVYQMDFDVFATQHGFASAAIQSMDGGPNRLVYLRR